MADEGLKITAAEALAKVTASKVFDNEVERYLVSIGRLITSAAENGNTFFVHNFVVEASKKMGITPEQTLTAIENGIKAKGFKLETQEKEQVKLGTLNVKLKISWDVTREE